MIERLFRERRRRVASIVGNVGDFELAEESTQEAFAIALRLPGTTATIVSVAQVPIFARWMPETDIERAKQRATRCFARSVSGTGAVGVGTLRPRRKHVNERSTVSTGRDLSDGTAVSGPSTRAPHA